MQPSIIFFDEIDGLAPVRSSKQDQIHASIVSTLLALMDGLDSRGQVNKHFGLWHSEWTNFRAIGSYRDGLSMGMR